METINLTVSGMTCGACVKHVEKAINSIAGVEKVEVDLASGAVKVEGHVLQHVKEIIAALEEDGYPAKISSDASPQAKAKSGSCKSGSSCCCN
jgi:copper chaperone CopZ